MSTFLPFGCGRSETKNAAKESANKAITSTQNKANEAINKAANKANEDIAKGINKALGK